MKYYEISKKFEFINGLSFINKYIYTIEEKNDTNKILLLKKYNEYTVKEISKEKAIDPKYEPFMDFNYLHYAIYFTLKNGNVIEYIIKYNSEHERIHFGLKSIDIRLQKYVKTHNNIASYKYELIILELNGDCNIAYLHEIDQYDVNEIADELYNIKNRMCIIIIQEEKSEYELINYNTIELYCVNYRHNLFLHDRETTKIFVIRDKKYIIHYHKLLKIKIDDYYQRFNDQNEFDIAKLDFYYKIILKLIGLEY